MGVLRLILALAVMIGHYKIIDPGSWLSDVFPYLRGSGAVSGAIKVNCFFIIAGFYAQLLLEEKFKLLPHRAWRFYAYRALRLLPLLYVVMVAFWITEIAFPDISFLDEYLIRGRLEDGISILHHVFILIPQSFYLPHGYFSIGELHQTAHHFIGPQLWAMALEISFIALAPWILLDKKRFYIIFALSVIGAAYFYHYGWVRNYLGSVLIYFIAGGLSYKLYKHRLRNWAQKRNIWIGYAMVAVLALGVVYFDVYWRLFGDAYLGYLYYMLPFWLMLPFIAYHTQPAKHDRKIGDFTYPAYLLHYLAFFYTRVILGEDNFALSMLLLALASCISVHTLEKTMLKYRKQIFSQQ